jgi:hypothetical protein
MINPDPAERFFTWLLTDATPALKPVQALENYGQRNWYVERDSHYGPLGFKYNGWPMWKAIWGVGGTVVSGGGLYIAPSFEGILGLTLGGYNAMNDVYEAKTGNKLPISEQTGRADAIINSTELGKDLVKIVKSARGAPNPMNILGITTFILDKTLFKDNLDNGEKSRDSSPTQQTKQTKKKVNWGMSPYAL